MPGPERALAKQGEPLSVAQRTWWHCHQDLETPVYNNVAVIYCEGALDAPGLEEALNRVVLRHEMLRSAFYDERGAPLRSVVSGVRLELGVADWTGCSEQDRQRELQRLVDQQRLLRFDLASGLKIRVTVARLAPAESVIILAISALVSDPHSLRVLVSETGALYRAYVEGGQEPLGEAPSGYADVDAERLKSDLEYWTARLSGSATVLIGADRPRGASPDSARAQETISLGAPLCEALRRLGEIERASQCDLLLTGLVALLRRYTEQDDITVAVHAANRSAPGLNGVIGLFANTLLVRSKLGSEFSFRQALRHVKERLQEARVHSSAPLDQVVNAVTTEPGDSRATVMFDWRDEPSNAFEVSPGVPATVTEYWAQASRFELAILFENGGDSVRGVLEYATGLYDGATIRRIASHYATLLAAAIESPDKPLWSLALFDLDERRQVLLDFNDTRRDYPSLCAHESFAQQAAKSPEALAVIHQEQEITYEELNRRADHLARRLIETGVGPGSCVGLLGERSIEMLVGLLATFKAGGAYVPLDSSYPDDRLAFMQAASGISVLLTNGASKPSSIATAAQVISLDAYRNPIALPDSSPPLPQIDSGLAYVVFTSGSTGKPKPVAIPHRTLSNLISWQLERLENSHPARVLQFAPWSLDVSLQEIFSTLCSGGTLILVPQELRCDPGGLLRFLSRTAVTRLFLPPVYLQYLAEAVETLDAPLALREVITAGERLHITPAVVKFFEALPGCSLDNQYGPSETHVVTSYRLPPDPANWPLPPIGRPIANTQVLILDGRRQLVPPGVVGEVYIGGAAVGPGYLNRPDLTAGRFIPNPFAANPGEALYATGDMARYRSDGCIEFLGRSDDQVKIRGYRIELGEIETTLAQCSSVQAAAVTVSPVSIADDQLIAYFVPAGDGPPSVEDLRAFMKERLPEYMIPSRFIALSAFPLTPTGKVNRRALPAQEQQFSRSDDPGHVAPRTTLEKDIASIWEQVLGMTPVGALTNFFDLGGHSLLALQIIARIHGRFGYSIDMADIFRDPTVAGMAKVLETRVVGRQENYIIPVQPKGTRPPFFMIGATIGFGL